MVIGQWLQVAWGLYCVSWQTLYVHKFTTPTVSYWLVDVLICVQEGRKQTWFNSDKACIKKINELFVWLSTIEYCIYVTYILHQGLYFKKIPCSSSPWLCHRLMEKNLWSSVKWSILRDPNNTTRKLSWWYTCHLQLTQQQLWTAIQNVFQTGKHYHLCDKLMQ